MLVHDAIEGQRNSGIRLLGAFNSLVVRMPYAINEADLIHFEGGESDDILCLQGWWGQ